MSGAIIEAAARPGTAHLAFPVYESVPRGCLPWRVDDDRHEPYLQRGDWVLIDAADREIIFGELFLLWDSKHATIWQICRGHNFDVATVDLHPLDRCRTGEEVDRRVRMNVRLHMSDTGLELDCAKRLIAGRVVGLLDLQAAYRKLPRDTA
jgi:hypothetical protein